MTGKMVPSLARAMEGQKVWVCNLYLVENQRKIILWQIENLIVVTTLKYWTDFGGKYM